MRKVWFLGGTSHDTRANTKQYKELASAQILGGKEVWGPIVLSFSAVKAVNQSTRQP